MSWQGNCFYYYYLYGQKQQKKLYKYILIFYYTLMEFQLAIKVNWIRQKHTI